MTNEKAREFFSAYYEGSLEPGLKLAFDSALATSRELQGEYLEFEAMLASVHNMQLESIEVPVDLSERIAKRIDKVAWERSRANGVSWTSKWRAWAFTGVASLAILGATSTLIFKGGSASSGANLVGASGQDQFVVKNTANGVVLSFSPGHKSAVIVRAEPDGAVLAQFESGPRMERKLTNLNADVAVMQVNISGDVLGSLIVLPGTQRSHLNKGIGSVEDMAKALAGFYRVPVVLQIANSGGEVNWDFNDARALKAAQMALKGRYTVDERDLGLLTIHNG